MCNMGVTLIITFLGKCLPPSFDVLNMNKISVMAFVSVNTSFAGDRHVLDQKKALLNRNERDVEIYLHM